MTNAREFTNRLSALLRDERSALAEFLVCLADFDRRRLWLELGYASLFDFLHRELALSKASASFRKRAAELIQQFPEIAEPLRDGRLCLTSMFELGKVLTPENRGEVLPRFFQLSRREAKSVAAELRPQEPPSRAVMVTAVAVPRAAAPVVCAPSSGGSTDGGGQPELIAGNVVCPVKLRIDDATPAREPEPAPVSPSRAATEPLTAELCRFHVTVSRRFLDKLEAARNALSHSHPGASEQDVLEAGLDLILERQAKRRGLVAKPRREPRPSKPGYVPAHVRRAVWARRRALPVADGRWRDLRLHAPLRARSRSGARARRPADRRESAGSLRRAQRSLGAADVRGRLDGQVHAPGARGGRGARARTVLAQRFERGSRARAGCP